MKNLILILVVFVGGISCNSSIDKQYQLEILNNSYQDKVKNINEIVVHVKSMVKEAGNRKSDQEVLNKVNHVIEKRTDSGMNIVPTELNTKNFDIEGLEHYSAFLESKIKEIKLDNQSINIQKKLKYYNTKLRSSFDAIYYTSYLINLSQLEILILRNYARQVGVSECLVCINYSMQSERDTVDLDELYKLVVFPLKNLNGTSTYSYDSIQIFHNDIKIETDLTLQQVGYAALINFSPHKYGKYLIQGYIIEKIQFIGISNRERFNKELFVE